VIHPAPGRREPESPLAIAALRDEEVERTRTFLRLGWIVAAGTAIAVLIVPGDRRIGGALLASLAVSVAGSA